MKNKAKYVFKRCSPKEIDSIFLKSKILSAYFSD